MDDTYRGEFVTKCKLHIASNVSHARDVLTSRAIERKVVGTLILGTHWSFDAVQLRHDQAFICEPPRCSPQSKLEWTNKILRIDNKTGKEDVVADQSTDQSTRCWDVSNQTNKGLAEVGIDGNV